MDYPNTTISRSEAKVMVSFCYSCGKYVVDDVFCPECHVETIRVENEGDE
jgi:uncharacterized OB-fold protein